MRCAGHRQLVLGAEEMGSPDAANSAFTDSNAVREWVEKGGSLLLITDHAPMGSAALNLAKPFLGVGILARPRRSIGRTRLLIEVRRP